MNDCFCSFFLMALITTCFFLLRLKLKWLKNGGAKVFIAAYGFLRIITFLAGDHNIQQVSNNSQNICSLFTSYIYQPKTKYKNGGSSFNKNEKYRLLKIEKKNSFLVNSFQKILIVYICVFSENAQCFAGAFLCSFGFKN